MNLGISKEPQMGQRSFKSSQVILAQQDQSLHNEVLQCLFINLARVLEDSWSEAPLENKLPIPFTKQGSPSQWKMQRSFAPQIVGKPMDK